MLTTAVSTSTSEKVLTDHADAIRGLGHRVVADVIEIGCRLTECKDHLVRHLGHGHWLAWLDAEFGWSDRTALNYMRAYELGLKSETVSDLDLPLRDLYRLAAPSTPTEIRDGIVARINSGESVTHETICEVLPPEPEPEPKPKPKPKSKPKSKPKPEDNEPDEQVQHDDVEASARARKLQAAAEEQQQPGSAADKHVDTPAPDGASALLKDLFGPTALMAAFDQALVLAQKTVAWPPLSQRANIERGKQILAVRSAIIRLRELLATAERKRAKGGRS
jgi:hypothetical protein